MYCGMAHTDSSGKPSSPRSSQLVRCTEGLTLKGRRVWPGHQALLILYLPPFQYSDGGHGSWQESWAPAPDPRRTGAGRGEAT